MDILLPFENGSLARVTLTLYSASKGQHRPIDAYVVTECEGIFTGSARRAAEAVFNLVGRQSSGREPLVAGFDIQGAYPGLAPATGESGGLAFAIALAGTLFNQSPGPLAATGVVKTGSGGSPVGRVNGIGEKVGSAVDHLPEQARILYPAANHAEIPEVIAHRAGTKRQVLCPVASVAEALSIVFPEQMPPRSTVGRKKVDKPRLVTLILALVMIIAAAVIIAGMVGSKTDQLDTVTTVNEPDSGISSLDQSPRNKGFD
jgi:hypothetical protein